MIQRQAGLAGAQRVAGILEPCHRSRGEGDQAAEFAAAPGAGGVRAVERQMELPAGRAGDLQGQSSR